MIDWQHQWMAAHYIKTMGKILYDFCGGEYSLDECEKFSFSGLKGTTAWNANKNKDNITDIINKIT